MKNNRQLKILELIETEDIRTQEELCRILKEQGYSVTQATVSRDIKELHLQKKPLSAGGTKYVLPDSREANAENNVVKYSQVLRHVLVSAVPAANIAVAKTLSGTANAAAAAIEAIQFGNIIGTLAGDDTLLVLFADGTQAADFCKRLNQEYIKE